MSNEKASLPAKNRNRNPEAPQTLEQAQTQTAGEPPLGGELGKYAALAAELASRVEDLSKLHTDRAGYQMEADSLKADRAELEGKVLDLVPDSGKELARLLDEELVSAARLSALERRIQGLESELHSKFPLALATFETLRKFVCASVLESCRKTVRLLIDPSTSVDQAHVDALAICVSPYVAISRVSLPSLSHTITRSLDVDQPHWSSLVRPYTAQEKADLRSATVKALADASNALVLAAERLCEAAGGLPDCPPFRCEAEVVVPMTVDSKFLEWQQPLGGSDAEFIAQHCKEAGKDPNNLSEADKVILAKLVEERHRMPQSHGVVAGTEMFGSTYQE